LECCKSAYNAYTDSLAAAPTTAATSTAHLQQPAIQAPKDKESEFFSELADTHPADGSSTVHSLPIVKLMAEFERYVSSPVQSRTEGIYEYMKSTGAKDYPSLVPAWRKYFCIPATSAPIECVFSTAGDVVTQDRCSLHGDAIESLVFVNRNLKLRDKFRDLLKF
jgi:hAT family C-terminal dimerisation region